MRGVPSGIVPRAAAACALLGAARVGVGAQAGGEKYFEAFARSDLLAGLRTRPKAREALRRMMVENYRRIAYIGAGHSQSPDPPTARLS